MEARQPPHEENEEQRHQHDSQGYGEADADTSEVLVVVELAQRFQIGLAIHRLWVLVQAPTLPDRLVVLCTNLLQAVAGSVG